MGGAALPQPRRTGLLIPVAADSLVGDFRRRHYASAVERRLPPHITVLFPFVPAAEVDDAVQADAARLFAAFEPFEATLTDVGTFDGYAWLVPEPRERFLALQDATFARFPAYPPYEGGGGEPEPHLTIAAAADRDELEALAEIARGELGPLLPFSFTVTSVSLFVEQDDGTWRESVPFPFG